MRESDHVELSERRLSYPTAQDGGSSKMSIRGLGGPKQKQNVQQQGFPRGHPP
jgi:hypothetical protein